MNWLKSNAIKFGLLMFFMTTLVGCATVSKQPIKLDPNFDKRNIDKIVLMPVVDRRVDKKAGINLEKDIRLPAKKILENKGYAVEMPEHFMDGSDIGSDQVGEMNGSDLADLGPQASKTLLFIYLDDILENYAVIAYTVKIEETGSLIDKTDKTEVWRDKGIGSSGQAGLISGVFSGMDKNLAISNALNNMLDTLPKRQKLSNQSLDSKKETVTHQNVSAAPISPPTVTRIAT